MDRDMVLHQLTKDVKVRRSDAVSAIGQADRTGVSDSTLTIEDVLANNTLGPDQTYATVDEILVGQLCHWQDEPSPEELVRRHALREKMAQLRTRWPNGAPG
jgi:hypothetical protein